MPRRSYEASRIPDELAAAFQGLVEKLEIRQLFPQQVLAEAKMCAVSGPEPDPNRVDLTGIDFVAIDPPGARDIDQALFIERRGSGYRVHYAIADVAAWVRPGGEIDTECQLRGQTFYAPHTRWPLHPAELSEDAASLLADGRERPAQVWQIELDESGAQLSAVVRRAWVKNRACLTYQQVQAELDADVAPESLKLLREVGQARQQIEMERGGVSLNLPDQEIVITPDGWSLEYRELLPVEGWNAQISLLTGMAAASMMVNGGIGILRTLPPARSEDLARLRRVAKSLQIPWPKQLGYPDFVRTLDISNPKHLAMMNSCTVLFRGAGYHTVRADLGERNFEHEAMNSHYSHVTAPLRRLVDRYVGECCVSLCAGREVPEWTAKKLPELPALMSGSDQRAKSFERATVDLVEALALKPHIGEVFDATVLDLAKDNESGVVALADYAIESRVKGRHLPLGGDVRVKLCGVDQMAGTLNLELVG